MDERNIHTKDLTCHEQLCTRFYHLLFVLFVMLPVFTMSQRPLRQNLSDITSHILPCPLWRERRGMRSINEFLESLNPRIGMLSLGNIDSFIAAGFSTRWVRA
jgi:hypothetical protein